MLLQAYDFLHLFDTLRMPAAAGRQRPVGEHHHGNRADPEGPPPRGLGTDHPPGAEGRRHQIRQDRDRHGLARRRPAPARTSCTSSSSGARTPWSAPTSATSRSSPTRRSSSSTWPPPSIPNGARPSGRWPARCAPWCTAPTRPLGPRRRRGPVRRGRGRARRAHPPRRVRRRPVHRRSPGPASTRDGLSLVDLLVETGLQQSKTRARSHVEGGGAYVNNRREGDPARTHRTRRPGCRPVRRPAAGQAGLPPGAAGVRLGRHRRTPGACPDWRGRAGRRGPTLTAMTAPAATPVRPLAGQADLRAPRDGASRGSGAGPVRASTRPWPSRANAGATPCPTWSGPTHARWPPGPRSAPWPATMSRPTPVTGSAITGDSTPSGAPAGRAPAWSVGPRSRTAGSSRASTDCARRRAPSASTSRGGAVRPVPPAARPRVATRLDGHPDLVGAHDRFDGRARPSAPTTRGPPRWRTHGRRCLRGASVRAGGGARCAGRVLPGPAAPRQPDHQLDVQLGRGTADRPGPGGQPPTSPWPSASTIRLDPQDGLRPVVPPTP